MLILQALNTSLAVRQIKTCNYLVNNKKLNIFLNTKPVNKKAKAKRKTTQASDLFTAVIKADLGAECVKEYKFHPTRRWRFDYALPEHKIAIEIDGGVWTQGRHTRPVGYLHDMEKFNEAAAMGWLVLKFTPKEQYSRAAIEVVGRTIAWRKSEGGHCCG